MNLIAPLVVAACVSASVTTTTTTTTSGSSGDGTKKDTTPARQLQSTTTRMTSGFLTMTLGTDTACTPVTAVIRVALGVCAQQGNSNTDDQSNNRRYVMNFVEQTGTNAQLMQAQYSDSACTSLIHQPLGPSYTIGVGYVDYVSYSLVSFVAGCGLVALGDIVGYLSGASNSLRHGANDDLGQPSYDTGMPGLGLPSPLPKYATVTYDAGFNALPAASSVSATWKAVAVYANGVACAQPATNTPVFFIATPVAVMDTCTANVACTDIRSEYSYFSGWGATWTEGCITVAPQTSGYMMVTQWTGGDPQQVRENHFAFFFNSDSRNINLVNTNPSVPLLLVACPHPVHGVHHQRPLGGDPRPVLCRHRQGRLLPRRRDHGTYNYRCHSSSILIDYAPPTHSLPHSKM